MNSFEVVAESLADTAAVGRALAGQLVPGDAVLLVGDLAAGKTTLVKEVAAALGATDTVTSPTFTLAQFYQSPGGQILHVDTYRLADLTEYRDLGLADYTDDCVSLIEWGDKVAGEFDAALTVTLTTEGGQRRRIRFSATAEHWQPRLVALRDAMVGIPA